MSLICWGCGFDCDSAPDFYWNCRWDIERGHGRGKGEAAGFNAGRDSGDAAVVGVDIEVAEEVKAPEVDQDGGGG